VAEDAKVSTFVDFLDGCKRIGMPLAASRDPTIRLAGDSPVEKMPIVQAYAFEDMGEGEKRGFFTMDHEVYSVIDEFDSLYARVDAHGISIMMNKSLPLLKYHWEAATHNFDLASGAEREYLTESSVCDPLSTYYSYGKLRQEEPGAAAGGGGEEMGSPKVLFGFRSGEVGALTSEATVGSVGALHATMEAMEPQGPLCVGRSYMLALGR